MGCLWYRYQLSAYSVVHTEAGRQGFVQQQYHSVASQHQSPSRKTALSNRCFNAWHTAVLPTPIVPPMIYNRFIVSGLCNTNYFSSTSLTPIGSSLRGIKPMGVENKGNIYCYERKGRIRSRSQRRSRRASPRCCRCCEQRVR